MIQISCRLLTLDVKCYKICEVKVQFVDQTVNLRNFILN